MRSLSLLLLLCLLIATHASMAAPQTVIHHCVDARGTPVFTDQPCTSVDARATDRTSGSPAGHACATTLPALRERIRAAFARHDANALAGLMLWHGYSAAQANRQLQHMARFIRQPLLGFVPDDQAIDEAHRAAAPAAAASAPADDSSAGLTLEIAGILTPAVHYSVQKTDGCLWLQPPVTY